MSNKKDLQNKIKELSDLAVSLPDGDSKIVINRLISKLGVTADTVLLDDGSINPLAAKMTPIKGLNPDPLASGDGYAVVCC